SMLMSPSNQSPSFSRIRWKPLRISSVMVMGLKIGGGDAAGEWAMITGAGGDRRPAAPPPPSAPRTGRRTARAGPSLPERGGCNAAGARVSGVSPKVGVLKTGETPDGRGPAL